MTAPRTIVVAGAGIGGLTASLTLAAQGFHVILHERAERLEAAGAGLQLSPNASRVLIELGLEPLLAPHVISPDAVSIMTARRGGEVIRMPLVADDRDHTPYWMLHRADLQSALLSKVSADPHIELRLASPITDFASDPQGVTVSGDTALALIGADGAWSAVRGRLFPDVTPRFSGLIAWRGTVDVASLPTGPAPRRVQLWMGPEAHLVAYPMSSGQRINMVVITHGTDTLDGSGDAVDAGDSRKRFELSGWPADARSMVDAVSDWRRWPLFTMPDGGVWHAGGAVALLGDAAHAMLPFAAQGAGMAIEDAAVLAKCLAGMSDAAGVPDALARYAELRRGRVGRVQRTARQSGQIYHLRGPMALARDLVMTALGARRLQARQDWIYRWIA
jgi:salicylate hydroxylase